MECKNHESPSVIPNLFRDLSVSQYAIKMDAETSSA